MSELPNVYEQNGITYYRASSLGRCIRAMVAQKVGFEPLGYGEKLEGIFHEGHLHEPDIIDRLGKDGWYVNGNQDEVTVMVTPTIAVRGHIDGKARKDGEGERILECKAFGESTFTRWKKQTIGEFFNSNPGYAYQLAVYMYGAGLAGGLYAVKNRNTGEILAREIDKPPVTLGGIKKRVLEVELAAKKYAEDGGFPACGVEMYPCPFYYLHDEKEKSDFGPDKEIEALAEGYAKARMKVQEAQRTQDECRDRIALALGDRGRVKSGQWSVSKSRYKRKKVDTKKLATVMDLSPYETEYEVEMVKVVDLTAKSPDRKEK